MLKSSPIEANSPLTNACLLCLDTAQHTTQWQPVMEREQDFRTGQQETSCFQETFATCDSLPKLNQETQRWKVTADDAAVSLFWVPGLRTAVNRLTFYAL